MTTPTAGVPVQLDRERRLRYPMSAIREIQARFDVNLMDGDMLNAKSLDDICWIITLGLRHEDPGPPTLWERLLAALGVRPLPVRPTEENVAEWLDMSNVPQMTNAMRIAMGGDPNETLEDVVARVRAAQQQQEGQAQPPKGGEKRGGVPQG